LTSPRVPATKAVMSQASPATKDLAPPNPADGLAIARARIATEATAKTGFLDLGTLGLTDLPEELFALAHLRSLNLGYGYADEKGEWHLVKSDLNPNTASPALARLSQLPRLSHLFVSGLQGFNDLAPLAALTGLQTLNCWSTQVSDLAPLAALTGLHSLDCSRTQVSDLAPLAALTGLQSLYCSDTQVSDLAPLAALTGLQTLDCSDTQVSDLAPLAALTGLQSLNCSSTQVSDLAPLAALTGLQTLFCYSTQVSDLAPLAALTGLQSLYCFDTQVSDLAPLAALTGLQTLACSRTQVSDLAPLAALTGLQTLDCSNTQVSDLAPLAALTSLQTLNCPSTQVSDLAPLVALTGLQALDCSYCKIADVPHDFWNKQSLTKVVTLEATIAGLPPELLSQDWDDNCLPRIRAHLADLAAGGEPLRDVKLMVLGNGQIGKTQLCRALRSESFDKTVPSTHGVLVTSASLPLPSQENAKLHIWDFGGQDIYHGTHALFARTRAIFAIIWTEQSENEREHEHDGVRYRNQPRAYWLDYVKQCGGKASPVLVVQTQCDDPRQELAISQSDQALLQTFSFKKNLHFSASGPRGLGALQEALGEAAQWLWQEQGIAEVGVGRACVKRRLEQLRDEDAARHPAERQNRTLSYAAFETICKDEGGISAPEYLAHFLHNCGTIFWRKGLFQDSLILDQAWALDAIYAVLHREKSLAKLKRQNGRFTLADLGEWIWNEAGHSAEEQQLFLEMMQSCGICFVHRREDKQRRIQAEYIAPDHLPDRFEIRLHHLWDEDSASETTTFDYPLLPETLMRNITSRIGAQAGLDAEYWQGGVYFYDAQTKSRAMIEQTRSERWQGSIRVTTQRGEAKTLLSKLIQLVTEEQSKLGLTPSQAPDQPSHREEAEPAKLTITPEPSVQPTWFVSYAWKDETSEGAKREEIVDGLCEEAEKQGKIILRDKEVLGLGDRIFKFMQRIGQGERVFVVLSDKYLRSPNCMFELYEIWRNSRLDDEEFLKRIRIFTLPDATIWTPLERAKWAKHWRHEFKALKEYLDDLGDADLHQYRLMKAYWSQIGNILATVADTLQPRTFEELVKYGFGE
jgi:internalin A